MKIDFYKYHGAGNDFIIIDNRTFAWVPDPETVALLCNRHFGIGADGLMLLSEKMGFDFGMTYFNADGRESTMCGNGGRCIAAFAHTLGITGHATRFHAIDGEHHTVFLPKEGNTNEYQIQLRMVNPSRVTRYSDGFFVNTGSPHWVIIVPNVSEIRVSELGRKLRNDPRFLPGGVNVDFVEILNDCLRVRTYERGVEDETLSCGTGVTAASLVAATLDPENPGRYRIITQGGELNVRFTRTESEFCDVWLEGPAAFVFKGEIDPEHLTRPYLFIP